MKIEYFFGFLFLLMLMQVIGVRRQVSQYRAAVSRLRQRGCVGIGGRKGRFGPGCVVILACDAAGTIVGAEVMQGMTIFSHFREVSDLYGRTVYDIQAECAAMPKKKRKHYQAYEQAASVLVERLLKDETSS